LRHQGAREFCVDVVILAGETLFRTRNGGHECSLHLALIEYALHWLLEDSAKYITQYSTERIGQHCFDHGSSLPDERHLLQLAYSQLLVPYVSIEGSALHVRVLSFT